MDKEEGEGVKQATSKSPKIRVKSKVNKNIIMYLDNKMNIWMIILSHMTEMMKNLL